MAFDPPPTQARARSGGRPSTSWSWRAASSPIRRWRSRTIVGIWVRAHRRAEDVVGRLDVRDPVAHRLVDGVLERGRAARDAPDFRAEGPHPEDVRGLAPDVLLAHEHDAGQAEEGAGRGRGHAVLAGAGLGDDAGLPEPAGQERLAEGVVDLVGTGVGEVLALEVEVDRGDRARAASACRARAIRGREPGRFRPDGSGQPVGPVERRRAAGEGFEELAQLGPEARVVTDGVIRGFELLERADERLGHVPTAEITLHPPPAAFIGLDETGMDRRRPDEEVGTVDPRGSGPLHEEGDLQRVLGRPLPGRPRRFDA